MAEGAEPVRPLSHSQELLHRLQEQRVMGLFCDVTVVVEGGTLFPAHRNVLSACSDLFGSLLSAGGDTVELKSVSPPSFAGLLEFVYTAAMPSSGLQEFYATAELLRVSLPLPPHPGCLLSETVLPSAQDGQLRPSAESGKHTDSQESGGQGPVCEQDGRRTLEAKTGAALKQPLHSGGPKQKEANQSTEMDQNAGGTDLLSRKTLADKRCPSLKLQDMEYGKEGRSTLSSGQEEQQEQEDSGQVAQRGGWPRGGKLYQCDQCGKQLGSLEKLRDHVAYHSDARPHHCRLCDKAYKVKNDLTQHIRAKHEEAWRGKPALVQLCEFCGQAVQHYKSHKLFCSGLKRFQCGFCTQSFPRLSELKRHTWTHTGDLPYQCSVCEKRCRHPSNLKKHMRVVHREDRRVRIDREHASPRLLRDFLPLHPPEGPGAGTAGALTAPAQLSPSSRSHTTAPSLPAPFSPLHHGPG
uniref:Zinc finger and BTB domain-containing protein 17-like n=1 Tax=Lepisosteus oculatus TaxID=7918 RepID=W5N592_LEPOC|nr:PREDICTED: zinc finger and BTB domain-containing protein 17-like [Lepisosteus oculatus]XP_015201459.1 PREDICTED: zinc finger and BTB domain-containing protein 17-like [Lepisosteus oculatus]